jgi:hypothetical protein
MFALFVIAAIIVESFELQMFSSAILRPRPLTGPHLAFASLWLV